MSFATIPVAVIWCSGAQKTTGEPPTDRDRDEREAGHAGLLIDARAHRAGAPLTIETVDDETGVELRQARPPDFTIELTVGQRALFVPVFAFPN